LITLLSFQGLHFHQPASHIDIPINGLVPSSILPDFLHHFSVIDTHGRMWQIGGKLNPIKLVELDGPLKESKISQTYETAIYDVGVLVSLQPPWFKG